ncbi:MAG: hypothetical protein ABL951_09490, partial [Alphaproteobacteria bacterium]
MRVLNTILYRLGCVMTAIMAVASLSTQSGAANRMAQPTPAKSIVEDAIPSKLITKTLLLGAT